MLKKRRSFRAADGMFRAAFARQAAISNTPAPVGGIKIGEQFKAQAAAAHIAPSIYMGLAQQVGSRQQPDGVYAVGNAHVSVINGEFARLM